MKKITSLVVLFTILSGSSRAELYLMDKIECVVCGPERNTPLVDSDASWKRSLDGQLVPMQQQLQQEIVSQQVVSDKIPLDPTAADKYIESMKKQNNLNDNDLKELFGEVGRTFHEGIDLLNNQYVQEMFLHYKFKSQLIPTEDDITKYYQEHPEYYEGWCEVQIAHVSFEQDTKDSIKKNLDHVAEDKSSDALAVDWSSSITLQQRDIAEDKKFITAMSPGQVIVKETDGAFELYKLIDKKDSALKSVDERRSSITEQLNRKKFEKMLQSYNQEVRKFVDIINLNESIVIQE